MDIDGIRAQLKELGYTVVPNLLSTNLLETLQAECEVLRELALNQSSAWGSVGAAASCIFEPVPGKVCSANPAIRTSFELFHKLRSAWPLRQAVADLLLTSSHLAQLVCAIMGPDSEPQLFNEQYIVKPGRSGEAASFAWHRDCEWCRDDTRGAAPYISVWLALDDTDDENGCIVVRPRSHAASSQFVHLAGLNSENNDNALSCSGADEDSLSLHLPAGSAVIMSHVLQHASGPNRTPYARRAWMPQFSARPILHRETNEPISLAIPLKPS